MEQALEAAAVFLEQNCGGWDPNTMRLQPERARIENGHVFVPWNARAFLDEGQHGKALLGNMPVLVDPVTGACRFMTLEEVMTQLRIADA
ncbi:YrhB domain-containing protein [Actinacidiphila sp. DG2A-62]|uniref:YrhB domain-containing protein n=1 Tax=Actinacidiphila sp. DG2A-62 TaxID=3108821 RepID=UPI002DB6B401|nr:YrhB domain-containing protein [Actinacidiphila sp. DG2A-62]MEC3992107.1 YrhB domain-containing protein [Actinacidiphila sp. DG2A-62]MEC3998878.1 YrhB domain-containing protein [Actinacidiphila sp. DG2A-62]